MKKLVSMILVLAMVFALSSLAVAAEKPVVNFWTTGSQNVADLFAELIAAYNAREDATAEIKLNFLLSGTGDEGLTSRVSSAFLADQKNTEFDMISDNPNSLMNYVDECGTDEIFIDLDFSKIPNYKNVLLKASMLQSNVLPYRGTTVVFAYDSARIPENELPHTWDELTQWIKDHPGRFAYNEPGTGGAADGFMRTAVYRFIDDPEARRSSDEKWAEEWDKGMEWLAEIHPFMY